MTLRCAIALIAFVVISASASCGSGERHAVLESSQAPAGGMSSVPFTPPNYMRPALNPLALLPEVAVAELPAEGILLFAQDKYNRIISGLPILLAPERSAEGLTVVLRAEKDAELPRDLLLYLRFDPQRFNPREARLSRELFPSRTHLQLALTDQRGFVPLAASALPAADAVRVRAADEIARVSFTFGPQSASRNTSAAPTGAGNAIEITTQVLGDNIRCLFTERNLGDYNLDGTVGVADLTAIAQHWGHRNADVQDPVIDIDGNSVGISDITPIAMHFGTVLSGYDLELEFTPEGGSAGEFERVPNETDINKPTMTRPNVTLPSGWPSYTFVADNQGYGTYRFRAFPIGATLAERGIVSNISSAVYENTPPAPPSSLFVTATTRTTVTLGWNPSPAGDLQGYNIYMTDNPAATSLADYAKVNAILLPTSTLALEVTDLTPMTDYWFAAESVDNKGLASFESQVLDTKVHAQTIVTPVAVLNVEAGDHYELYTITFDGIGSNSPDGAAIVSYTYDWGDETAPEVFPTSDPVTHTYQFPYATGVNVKLTVEDEYGVLGSTQQAVIVKALRKDVLVVYNTNSPDDLEIANYYADPWTGRGIHPDCVLGMGLSLNEEIDRTTYNTTIRQPIRDYIDATFPSHASIYYIVTCKNVPLKVSGADNACVDSELTLLWETYDLASGLYNPYYGWSSSGGYADKGNMSKSQPWQPMHFTATEPNWLPTFGWNGTDSITIDYLVTRLTAYTLDEVKAVIDRGRTGFSGSDYYVILDDKNWEFDRMSQPPWPSITSDDESATIILTRYFPSHLYSDTTHQDDFITAAFLSDPSISSNVLGYCSRGIHAGYPVDYILNNLGFTYLPGALFMSYESFNGWSFQGPTFRNGQGLIGDFLRMGGTGGVGNVYEPYSHACGDESIMFAEYFGGRNLAEACYKGIMAISWQEVIVGDPLCEVNVQ